MTMVGPAQLCTFRVGGALYGLDAVHVQEVLAPQPITPVSRAPDHVAGLINLRGTIVTALRLDRRLDVEAKLPVSARSGVVVITDGPPVSLLVDELGQVLRTTPSRFEPRSTADATRFVVAAYCVEDELLAVLDATRIAAVAPRTTATLPGREI